MTTPTPTPSPRRTAAGARPVPVVSSKCHAGFHQGYPAAGGGCPGPGGREVAGYWLTLNTCGCSCHGGDKR